MGNSIKTTKYLQCEEIYRELVLPDEEPDAETKNTVCEMFVTYTDVTEGTALVYFSMISNRIKNPETALRKPLSRNRGKYDNLDRYDTDYDAPDALVAEAFR